MRYGTATRIALCGLLASGVVGAGLFACNDVIKDEPLSLTEREAGGSGGSSGNGPEAPTTCKTACCPTDPKCFVSGKEGPGSECLATRDNTDKTKIQLRQTWVYPTTPAGLRLDEIYTVLNLSTALPMCQTPTGAAGYVRVMETDLETDISRVGWATYVGPTEVDDALTNGLCMIQSPAGGQGWIDTATLPDGRTPRALRPDQIYQNPNYPPGLPQPAAQPWLIRPTKARRVPDNFELGRDGEGGAISATNKGKLTEAGQAKRRELLAKTLDQENVDAGVTGFYHMDQDAGTVHGFATIAYQVIYNVGKLGESYIVVPIHEPETFQKYTDSKQRNCVGVYRAGQVEDVDCGGLGKAQDPAMAAWSGVDTSKIGVGDAWTKGYFLIAELEQIYVDLLSQTLCFSYPGQDADLTEWGTATNKTCRATGKWDATKPTTNMPRGDWCSETNGPADENCADAWLTIAYHGFAAANIREGTCDP